MINPQIFKKEEIIYNISFNDEANWFYSMHVEFNYLKYEILQF